MNKGLSDEKLRNGIIAQEKEPVDLLIVTLLNSIEKDMIQLIEWDVNARQRRY